MHLKYKITFNSWNNCIYFALIAFFLLYWELVSYSVQNGTSPAKITNIMHKLYLSSTKCTHLKQAVFILKTVHLWYKIIFIFYNLHSSCTNHLHFCKNWISACIPFLHKLHFCTKCTALHKFHYTNVAFVYKLLLPFHNLCMLYNFTLNLICIKYVLSLLQYFSFK